MNQTYFFHHLLIYLRDKKSIGGEFKNEETNDGASYFYYDFGRFFN